MSRDDFPDAALIVVGHGSTKNNESAAPVYQHVAELRRRKMFAAVHEAFWKQEPRVKRVLAEVTARRVFIVPLFMSEGYFSSQVIPRELGFSAGNPKLKTPSAELFYCKPVGTHDRMTDVLLARACGVVEQFPFPRAPQCRDITLFIAGHGTGQDEHSRQAVERQVERIRARNEYADVTGVFLEEEPRIDRCYGLAATRNLVLVPFFVSDGLHTREDIPVLLGAPRRTVQERIAAGQPAWRNPTERNGKLVWFAPAVGTAPEIAGVIHDRVREAAA